MSDAFIEQMTQLLSLPLYTSRPTAITLGTLIYLGVFTLLLFVVTTKLTSPERFPAGRIRPPEMATRPSARRRRAEESDSVQLSETGANWPDRFGSLFSAR